MGQIFVSYSRQDKGVADALVDKLTAAGLDIWIDREDIRAGRHWRTEIVTALDTCDAFILLLSPHSASSDNVLKEVTLADGAKRRIFPIMITQTELLPDMRYLLAGVQIIDMVTGDLNLVYQQLEAGLLENQRMLAEQAEKMKKSAETREAEIVIKGVDIKDFDAAQQEKLLFFLSEMTGTKASEMSVANLSAGSVHVFIEMPAQSAFSLKALALNDDPRFRKFGIVAVSVSGSAFVASLTLPFWVGLVAWFTGAGAAVVGTVAVVTTVVIVIVTRQPTNEIIEPVPTMTYIVTVVDTENELDVVGENTETPLPIKTDTPVPTETDSPTATAETPPTSVTADIDTVCRSTFNRTGDIVSYFIEGETSLVLAVNPDGHWFYISLGGARCWVSDATVTLRGSLEGITVWYPTATDSPTETPSATITKTSTVTFTKTPIATKTPTATKTAIPTKTVTVTHTPTLGPPTATPVPGGVTGLVWGDIDMDKIYTYYYDLDLAYVTVNLMNATCANLLSSTLTNPSGEYEFLNLTPGKYCVIIDISSLPSVSSVTWDADLPDFPIGDSPFTQFDVLSGANISINFSFVQR